MALTKTPSELTAADLTITTAAQPNITSLGTLTALQVDNVNINGNTISSTDTNGNIVLTANGTGNVNVNTDVLAIQGTEGESASLALQADESDDAGDEWRITTNTNQTLSIQNNISGSGVDHMTFTPHATVASSTVTIPGKVGIGATTLTRELTVQENGQSDISIVAATNQYGQLLFGDTDADNKGIVGYNNSTDILEFWTSGSRRVAIDSGGHTGIKTTTREDGSTAMAFPLTINGGDDSGNIIEAFRTANSKFQLYMSTGGTVYADVTGTTPLLKIRTSGTDRVNIHESNGYVGLIGSSDVRLTLSSEGTEGDNSANWVRGNSAGLSFNAKTSGKFMWEINGSEKMRMDSTGNLAIGGSPVLLSSGYDGAQLHIRQSVSNGGAAIFLTEGNGGHTTSDGAIFSIWNDGHVYMQNQHNGAFRWYMDASLRYSWSKDYLYPELDDSLDLGLSNKRWDDIYASSGTVNSSDETLKRDINALSEAEKAVALKIKGLMRTFRWKSSYEKKGDDARYHTGVVAQQVEALFKEEGLDISKYAFWVKGVHYVDSEGKEIVDEYGAYITPNMPAFEKITDKKEAYRYSIRYDQLLCFIIGAM